MLDKNDISAQLVQERLYKINRSLIKTIVMPLIYGKTAHGFAEDLREFFAKKSIYPSESVLFKLAQYLINLLKNHSYLELTNQFMFCLRNFAKIAFDINNVRILRPIIQQLNIIRWKLNV